jgi:rod shape determining protein RodA
MAITARQIRELVDWPLVLAALGLMVTGWIGLASSTGEGAASRVQGLANVQLLWYAIGLIAAVAAMSLPTRFWHGTAYIIYIACVILLLLTLFVGQRGMGAERWLVLGPLRIQPSEITKVAFAIALARFLSTHHVSMTRIWDIVRGGILLVIPCVLIWGQPDLGTAVVYLAIYIPMVYWAGLKNLHLFAIVSPLANAACAFGGWVPWLAFIILFVALLYRIRPHLAWVIALVVINLTVGVLTPQIVQNLKPHQKRRIEAFFSPDKDPLGAGYQIIQSQVAIGSGGKYGKGFKQGSQTQLAYLPETHTDFIFAVIGEEWGFAGTSVILALLLILTWRIMRLSLRVGDPFASYLCVGIGAMVFFHSIVNVGMTVGLMPVTGLPLPLVSYGGSSMVTTCFAFGLVLGAGLRRYE